MHRGLPLVTLLKLLAFGSSESGFGTSFNSMILVGLHAVHFRTLDSCSGLRYLPSSSWMGLYVPLSSDIISICNAVLKNSEVLKYSFPSLKSCYPIK